MPPRQLVLRWKNTNALACWLTLRYPCYWFQDGFNRCITKCGFSLCLFSVDINMNIVLASVEIKWHKITINPTQYYMIWDDFDPDVTSKILQHVNTVHPFRCIPHSDRAMCCLLPTLPSVIAGQHTFNLMNRNITDWRYWGPSLPV